MIETQKESTSTTRFAVVSPVDPRRARTNSLSDVRLCCALRSQGHDVEWIVPSLGPLNELSTSRVLEIHGATQEFDVRFVRTLRSGGPLDLARILPLTLPRFSRNHAFAISRDVRLLIPMLLIPGGPQPVPWLHEYRGRHLEDFVYRRARAVLATNSTIVNDIRAVGIRTAAFVTGNPILRDGAARREGIDTKERARRKLGLTGQAPLIVYTGKVVSGMVEIDHIADAAAHLPHCHFLLTGGQPAEIKLLREKIGWRSLQNIEFVGFLERADAVRLYQQAADVLVSYYSRYDHPHARHNLPNKLAEYMSTGNPVVVADFPAVRDVATTETAVLVRPDDPTALADALSRILNNPDRAAQLGGRARRFVEEHSFEQVAAGISLFLRSQGGPNSRGV